MVLRIRNLIRKELIQLRRDVVLTGFIVTLPVLQLALLARATAPSIVGLDVTVVDHDWSAASRRAVEALGNQEALEIYSVSATLGEAERLLDQGDSILAVVIPAGFSEALNRSADRASIQVIVDGSNDLIADIALAQARAALTDFARAENPASGGGSSSPVDLRTTVRFNPSFDVKLFTLPAQVGFIVYQVTLAVASTSLARERELGTLEQLIVMPMSRLELVVGKAVPALIVGMINFLFMLGVAVWGFGVPMRGSLWLLLALTLLFVLAEIGYGMVISGIAHTQQQAILFVFALAMVDMAFSGYLVPIASLPTALRAIARVVPLRHQLAIMRNVMLKGAGLSAIWSHVAGMLGMGVLVTAVAVRSLSHGLD